MTATTAQPTSFHIERTVEISASMQQVFNALLEQLGAAAQMPDGTPMPMKFEAWPGGRWFRDLGNDSGHFWGMVQVIKPPHLIEIHGPLFMSYPAISHIQYRLVENDGQSTTLQFAHRAMGEIDPEHAEKVGGGWEHQLDVVKKKAELQ